MANFNKDLDFNKESTINPIQEAEILTGDNNKKMFEEMNNLDYLKENCYINYSDKHETESEHKVNNFSDIFNIHENKVSDNFKKFTRSFKLNLKKVKQSGSKKNDVCTDLQKLLDEALVFVSDLNTEITNYTKAAHEYDNNLKSALISANSEIKSLKEKEQEFSKKNNVSKKDVSSLHEDVQEKKENAKSKNGLFRIFKGKILKRSKSINDISDISNIVPEVIADKSNNIDNISNVLENAEETMSKIQDSDNKLINSESDNLKNIDETKIASEIDEKIKSGKSSGDNWFRSYTSRLAFWRSSDTLNKVEKTDKADKKSKNSKIKRSNSAPMLLEGTSSIENEDNTTSVDSNNLSESKKNIHLHISSKVKNDKKNTLSNKMDNYIAATCNLVVPILSSDNCSWIACHNKNGKLQIVYQTKNKQDVNEVVN